MIAMIAKKRVKYPHGPSGREYAPGEPFNALSERDAKGLRIAGKADYAPAVEAGTSGKNITDLPASELVEERPSLPALRAELEGLTGRKPYNGWDADELRSRILKAKEVGSAPGDARAGEYLHRSMRARE